MEHRASHVLGKRSLGKHLLLYHERRRESGFQPWRVLEIFSFRWIRHSHESLYSLQLEHSPKACALGLVPSLAPLEGGRILRDGTLWVTEKGRHSLKGELWNSGAFVSFSPLPPSLICQEVMRISTVCSHHSALPTIDSKQFWTKHSWTMSQK